MSVDITKINIKTCVSIINLAKEDGKRFLNEILSNEEIPLFDRWNYFMKFGSHLLPVDGSIIPYNSVARSWFDEKDRWPQFRGKQVLYEDYFEEDWVDVDQVDPDTGKRPDWLTEELISEIRTDFEQNIPEEVVRDLFAQGFSGFTYDW